MGLLDVVTALAMRTSDRFDADILHQNNPSVVQLV